MDAFSLVLGSLLGGLVGWAFSSASSKQRDAGAKRHRVNKTQEELLKMVEEAKDYRESSFTDVLQSVMFRVLGVAAIMMLVVILAQSLG
ncbi:MAG: hypothetical protein U0401_09130 [Anaerolineae bacterium]